MSWARTLLPRMKAKASSRRTVGWFIVRLEEVKAFCVRNVKANRRRMRGTAPPNGTRVKKMGGSDNREIREIRENTIGWWGGNPPPAPKATNGPLSPALSPSKEERERFHLHPLWRTQFMGTCVGGCGSWVIVRDALRRSWPVVCLLIYEAGRAGGQA